MTWKTPLFTLLPALSLGVSAQVAAQDEIFAETQTVMLDPADPDNLEVGELIFVGGVEIEPGDEDIGGISGLEWYDEEETLYAVSDDGHWLTITPDEINGRLVDILTITKAPLLDERGRRLRGRSRVDAEAITRSVDGAWLVAFEREHRVWRYTNLAAAAEVEIEDLTESVALAGPNLGLEAIASNANGGLFCVESYSLGEENCVTVGEQGIFDLTGLEIAPPTALIEHGGAPTDAACQADGTCFVLFRSYREGEGNRAAILKVPPEGEIETLAVLLPPLTLDNFEGLAVREQFGKTYLYVVSDNNFSDNQRTLLMKFEIKVDEPIIAAAPEPVIDYDTTDVVLVTALGDITIRLETERAPITTANFLRYVDEDRFDGTGFYRAMRLNREPMPNGLIQAGTRFDPARILPGIEHEPTTLTGLSHTHGALSMAMGDPGTANGDFSIMLQDQTGLDARPESDEPIWQNGYAVFGYVIDGMDVVSTIHAAPTDPDAGEGAMRGQLLAEEVTIIDAYRAEVSSE